MLLLIDNYDSFTYNLEHYVRSLGHYVQVVRNDALDVAAVLQLKPQSIVISPGPGTPDDAGICLQLIEQVKGTIPLLGVCLGHQCIVQALGGEIVKARQVMHGKTSDIQHENTGLFANLQHPLRVTRYHSLLADPTTLPAELEVTAWTTTATGKRDEIMAVQQTEQRLYGVQFHPEAILTEQGHQLLKNFLELCE